MDHPSGCTYHEPGYWSVVRGCGLPHVGPPVVPLIMPEPEIVYWEDEVEVIPEPVLEEATDCVPIADVVGPPPAQRVQRVVRLPEVSMLSGEAGAVGAPWQPGHAPFMAAVRVYIERMTKEYARMTKVNYPNDEVEVDISMMEDYLTWSGDDYR